MTISNSDSVYKTPESELLKDEILPQPFVRGKLTYRKLLFFAWLAIFYLIATIPAISISFMSGIEPEKEFYVILGNVFNLLDSAINIYLLLMFKQLLNLRLETHTADRYITILIVLSLIMAVLNIFIPAGAEEFNLISISFFVLLVPMGVVSILFGLRLLKLKSDYNYLKLFSWSNIIMGGLLASVVLFILALPVGLVSSFAMAMIFFTAARERKQSDSDSSSGIGS
ncbi:MAG: hypothetical protein ABW158_00035 [Candidatus Thiodiazotropha sp. 6PDIVS]